MTCSLIITMTLMISSIIASPVHYNNDASLVNIRLIKEIDAPTRHKRSVLNNDESSGLPYTLIIGVPVQEGDDNEAVLRLHKTSLLPTQTSNGTENNSRENAAVYTDHSRQSSMIVRQDADAYSLQGTFHHSGKDWNLQPSDATSSAPESHQLSQLRAKEGEDIISFAGDEYTIDGKLIEEHPSGVNDKNATRVKRAATQHVIEIAFVVDFEDYSKWVAMAGSSSNAIKEMRLWYTYVAESINIRYNTIQDSEIAINTRVTLLKIITRDSQDDFIEAIVTSGQFDGLSGLREFRSWIGQQGDIPPSDHYMLFTGFEIRGATGIAFGNAMCSSSSVSISENTFQATLGGIAAHELGHSLSAFHDSSDGCNDQDQYIMSTVLSTPIRSQNRGNPWRFSPCSVQRFKDYLRRQSCTLAPSTNGEDALPAPQGGQRAGQVLGLDDQCRRLFKDDSSFFCRTLQIQQGGLGTLCGGMYCAIPGRNGVCQTSLPQEFSSCGNQKWCVLGQCVNREATPQPTNPPTTTTTTTTTAPPKSTTIREDTTTVPPTLVIQTTDATPSSQTTTSRPGPIDVTNCFVYAFRDWNKWWACVRRAVWETRRLEEQTQRRQLGQGNGLQVEQRWNQVQQSQRGQKQGQKRRNNNRRF